jgi:hypothetical protein
MCFVGKFKCATLHSAFKIFFSKNKIVKQFQMKNLILTTACLLGLFTACKNADTTAKTDKAPEVVAAPPPPPVAAPAPDNNTKCYLMTLKKDSTVVQLTIKGDAVEGFHNWQPHEKDGGHGVLKGTVKDGIVNADFTYMIEGSIQKEAKMYKIEGDALYEGEGELVEKGDKLVIKNPAKVKWANKLLPVDCSKVAHTIAAIKETPGLK